ncbi:MAG: ATP-binding protein [Thermodesulfobacteriota bacterium]|nr:ATP-binding protein [Thermodesulfobacteriota bacterium]
MEDKKRKELKESKNAGKLRSAGYESEYLYQLGKMAGSLVHEIKNPLNTLYINSQILEEELEEIDYDNKKEIMEIARANRKEIQRLENILTEFLRFSKLQAFFFEPVNMNKIISEVISFFEAELERKKINIIRDISNGSPLIAEVDVNQIKQILYNIILNASQAMENGGILRIMLKREGDNLTLTISDDGIGIPEKNRERVFDPFFSTKKKGTGLGLAIVKRAVDIHKGKISVESKENQGTTFNLTLPLVH